MEFEITENDYLQKLDSAVFSDSVTDNVVRCTNSQCTKPAIPVSFALAKSVTQGEPVCDCSRSIN